MLTTIRWFPEKGRKSGTDNFGVNYEAGPSGTTLATLSMSAKKRLKMRPGDWIIIGASYPRRVSNYEMVATYKQTRKGQIIIIGLKPGKTHPWAVKPKQPGFLARLFGSNVAKKGGAAAAEPDIPPD